ncbi:MAG: AAA family ATPase [Thermoplasmata archaeon]
MPEIIGQPEVIGRLQRLAKGVQSGSIVPPSLLLHDPPGIGKTTAVRAFAREVLGNDFENSFSELKAFDDRSSNRLAEIILNSRLAPKRDAPFRILFFDEIETLRPESQNALRPAVEGEGGTSLYILACNDLVDVSRPLQSRCTILEFRPVSPEDMRRILLKAISMTPFTLDQSAWVFG